MNRVERVSISTSAKVSLSPSANRTNIYDGSVAIYGGTAPLTETLRSLRPQVEEEYWKCPNCGNYESEKVDEKAGSK